MALQLSLSSLSLRSPSADLLCPNQSLNFSNNSFRLCNTSRNRCFRFSESKKIGRDVNAKCGGSNLDTVGFVLGQVTEVNKDTFWPIVKEAGEKIVVLDMYTQWCGPCKVIAPKVQELSEKYLDVVFLKLDCNQENKPLAKELGVRVVPTFKILKDCKIVKEITGAKFDDLLREIDIYRSK